MVEHTARAVLSSRNFDAVKGVRYERICNQETQVVKNVDFRKYWIVQCVIVMGP